MQQWLVAIRMQLQPDLYIQKVFQIFYCDKVVNPNLLWPWVFQIVSNISHYENFTKY